MVFCTNIFWHWLKPWNLFLKQEKIFCLRLAFFLSLMRMQGKCNSWGLLNFTDQRNIFEVNQWSSFLKIGFHSTTTPSASFHYTIISRVSILFNQCFQTYVSIRLIPICTDPLSFDLTFIPSKYSRPGSKFSLSGCFNKFHNLGFISDP